MATSKRSKLACVTCNKATGIFTCRGCEKDFCSRHAIEHRQILGKQMDEITVDHNQIQQNLVDCTKDPRRHPLIKQIDEWERQSMKTIHQVAEDARKLILNNVNKYKNKITENLVYLTQELNKARQDDDFVETDIKEWLEKLDKLKSDLALSNMISIRHDPDTNPLITRILVSINPVEVFEQIAGNIHIANNGQMIVHGQPGGYGTARGKGEYLMGKKNQFRFKIEQLSAKKSIFFGIVSKDTAIQRNSRTTPTVHGWGGENSVCLNGSVHDGYNGYKSDVEVNDILELLIDVDQHTIRLTNERTHSTYELNIDVTKCPLPWQLNLGLLYLIMTI